VGNVCSLLNDPSGSVKRNDVLTNHTPDTHYSTQGIRKNKAGYNLSPGGEVNAAGT
jgi:hypothetical protein